MLQSCQTWDVRRQAATPAQLHQRLHSLHTQEALLVISKTSFLDPDWSGASYPLIDGPSVYFQLWAGPGAGDGCLRTLRAEQHGWLERFADLRVLTLSGGAFQAASRELQDSILARLDWEERTLYPHLERWLGTARPGREMSYEHQGLRTLLGQLEPRLTQLAASPEPAARARLWEKLSLDLIHLLEHHIEHEERSFFPIAERTGFDRSLLPPPA